MKTQQEAKQHHFVECGLDNIWLVNGFKIVETKHGRGIAIDDLPKLYEAIARGLVTGSASLRGREIAFLRRRLRKTQAELASDLGVDKQTVGRWERDEIAIPDTALRLLRYNLMAHLDGTAKIKKVADLALRLADEIREVRTKHTFAVAGKKWQEKRAAA
jgi:DNA-binding transcriptional regulator YiaG